MRICRLFGLVVFLFGAIMMSGVMMTSEISLSFVEKLYVIASALMVLGSGVSICEFTRKRR